MRNFWVGYWFKGWHFAYKIGFSIVITGARTYYRNFMYLGKEKIPKNAGIIYAINHQNAFTDLLENFLRKKVRDENFGHTLLDIGTARGFSSIII